MNDFVYQPVRKEENGRISWREYLGTVELSIHSFTPSNSCLRQLLCAHVVIILKDPNDTGDSSDLHYCHLNEYLSWPGYLSHTTPHNYTMS